MLSLEQLKPQTDVMRAMYKAGYEAGLAEGKRLAWVEVKAVLEDERHAEEVPDAD